MEFRFTDEQRMIFDSAADVLASVSDSSAVRHAMRNDPFHDETVWRRLCQELYWQALLIPEECGGLGLGFVETVGVLERMGQRLFVSPFFSSSVMATSLLRLLPQTDRQASLFNDLLEGQCFSVAHTDAAASWSQVSASAVADGQAFRLRGEYRFVSFGHVAQQLLVVATIEDTQRLGVFVVDAQAQGVTVVRTPTLDQTRPMASVSLQDVLIAETDCLSLDAGEALIHWLDLIRICLAADQVGGAQESLDISVAYVGERVQFGRTIASFQAIKHKAADVMVKVEAARSLLYYAACVADEFVQGFSSADELLEAAAMVNASASEAYFFAAGSGIQMHGGVGITEEYDIQLYFKRARSTERYLGSPEASREKLAGQLLDSRAGVGG
jgi:alkylation response protein AidB-like acyl-CoA dehydrogenase